MNDTRIHIFYQFGDIDTYEVDSVTDDWAVDDGLFIIRHDAEPILIANMNTITCIKVENSDSENFPKNKKDIVDSDLRISANIMREEYRKNPEFREAVIRSVACAAAESNGQAQHIADTIFGYETDSNN